MTGGRARARGSAGISFWPPRAQAEGQLDAQWAVHDIFFGKVGTRAHENAPPHGHPKPFVPVSRAYARDWQKAKQLEQNLAAGREAEARIKRKYRPQPTDVPGLIST